MIRKLILILAVLLTTFVGSSNLTQAQPNPFEKAPDDPERAARAFQDQVDEIRTVVEKLRGLTWKFKTPSGIFTREQLKEMLEKEFESQKEALRSEGKLLQMLGVLKPGIDLGQATSGLYAEGIAGFYDPNTKKLNLIRDDGGKKNMMMVIEDLAMRVMLGTSQDEMIIAHELTHALDDQYFDLMNVIDFEKANNEEQLVRLAVTEGTAVSLQYDYLFRKNGVRSYENPQLASLLETVPGVEAVPGAEGMAEVPPMLVRQMIFPYTMGNRLVFEARRRAKGDWAVVNNMFEKLPASTEQILHPEKYLDSPVDNPLIMTTPDQKTLEGLFGDGWRQISRDSFGEFKLWLYLEDFFMNTRSGKSIAKSTSEGWDGDSLVLMESNQQLALIWKSTWDTEEDAKQFLRTYRLIVKSKYKLDDVGDSDNLIELELASGNVKLERHGQDVLILENVPSSKMATISEVLWASPKVEWTRPARGTTKPEIPFPWDEKK